MIRTFNFANIDDELAHFDSESDMRQFAKQHGCDGIELQVFQEMEGTYLTPDLVQGIHLSFYNCWMDFWTGNKAGLIEEYGTAATAQKYYGGTNGSAILEKFQKELDAAQACGVKYVVFHVSEVTIAQCYHHQFAYKDEEVVDAACEIINQLLKDRHYTFDFLMENLWWPGLNFMQPQITKRLLDGVQYEKKGLMLDTGHLMNTNPNLRTEEEAVAYIHKVLDTHEELLPWIKGMHLNASLSGAYVQEQLLREVELKPDYWEKRMQAFEHIFCLDEHKPFCNRGRQSIVDRVEPQYLTHELITRSREELSEFLNLQRIAR